jgi:hypothetical protein
VDERQRARIRGAKSLPTPASAVAGANAATPVAGFVAAMVTELRRVGSPAHFQQSNYAPRGDFVAVWSQKAVHFLKQNAGPEAGILCTPRSGGRVSDSSPPPTVDFMNMTGTIS